MTQTGSAAWAAGPRQRNARLLPDVRVFRKRAWVIVVSIALTVVAAILVSSYVGSSYTSQSQLIVTPVSRDDPTFTGLSVIRESSDATRDVTTLTAYAETQDVRNEAGRALAAQGFTPAQVESAQNAVVIEPVASSSLVSIIATAKKPEDAATIANAFADATVAVRQATFNQQVAPKLQRAQAALAALPGAGAAAAAAAPVREELVRQISLLQQLSGGPDPSFQVLSKAEPSTSPSGPGLIIIIPAAIVAGLILGGALVALSEAVRTRRVEDEDELLEAFGIPIITRVPRLANPGPGVVTPDLMSPSATQAYRSLSDTVETLRLNAGGARVIAFASTTAGTGTTTSALNTAVQLVGLGHRVLLIDADLRRHSLTDAVDVAARYGTRSALERRVSLRTAVVPSPNERGLDLLLANPVEGFNTSVVTSDNVRRLVAQAQNVWDFVILDTANRSPSADLMALLRAVNDVVVVVRRSYTAINDLDRLIDTLVRDGVEVKGFVVLGGKRDRGQRPVEPATGSPDVVQPSVVTMGENT